MSGRRKLRSDSGYVSLEFLAAVSMSFVILVFMANFIVIQYGRGVVRAAADEGARAGSRVATDPQALCQQRADSTLEGLGNIADNVRATCVIDGTRIVANVHADFEPWFSLIPTFTEDAVGSSVQEQQFAPAAVPVAPPVETTTTTTTTTVQP